MKVQMKGWKRCLGGIVIAFLCAAAMAACRGRESDELQGDVSQRVKLHVWGNQPLSEFGPIITAFETEYEDIEIVYHVYQASDAAQNLKLETNLLAGGSNVDVYFTYTTQALSKRIKAKLALDLSELCTRDEFDMEQSFTENVTKLYYNQKPYSVPTTVGKMGIILNKDMFDAAGLAIPTDWDFQEFREICRKLTCGTGSDKVYGVFWNTPANPSEALLHLVLPTLGGDPLYKDNGKKSNMDHPVIAQALRLMDATMNVDGSAPDYKESQIRKLSMEEMFFGGHCAMTVGAWMYGSATNKESYPHDFVTAFAPWPVADKSERNYTQGSLGGHMAINPGSQNVEEAWTFIKWYSTKGAALNIQWGYTPCYTGFSQETVETELFKNAGGMLDEESAKRVLLNPDTHLSIPVIEYKIDVMTEIFDHAVEQALIGETDVDTALSRAVKEADEALER